MTHDGLEKWRRINMKYAVPEVEIILFDSENIITSSLTTDTGDIPIIPGDGEEPW